MSCRCKGGSSIATPISVANGGFGQDMTMQSVSLIGSQTAFPFGLIKWTGGSGNLLLKGITAPATSNFCYIQNVSPASWNIIISNQDTGATAANRIITYSGSNITINPGFSVVLFYDTVSSRWRVISDNYIISISNPLIVSSSGNLSIPQSSPTFSGYLSSSDWSTFNNKVGGFGYAGTVPYWNTPYNVTYTPYFSFDSIKMKFGVGVNIGTQEATGHFKSDTAETLSGLSGISATLTASPIIPIPVAYTATQITGSLYAPNSFSSYVYSGTTNYMAGDVIDYRITSYNNTGSGNIYSVVNSPSIGNTIITGSGASDGDQVNLTWTDNTGGATGISGYLIERQVNGGGYGSYCDVGYVNSFNDDGTLWVGGSGVTTPTFPDFIANGSTRHYSAYIKDVDPAGGELYSSGHIDVAFTDDSSGNPYKIQHYGYVSQGVLRVLNTDLTTYTDQNVGTGSNFIEDTTQPFTSGSNVSPNTYGLISDGANWNRNYDFYNYDSTLGIYSTSSGIVSTVDPNDGLYYYVPIDFTGVASYAKILVDKNGSGYIWSGLVTYTPFYDDFTGNDVTVTPNATYPSTGLFESHGSDLTSKPTLNLRSLDGTYTRLDFQDSTGTRVGFIDTRTGAALNLFGPGTPGAGSGSIQITQYNLNLFSTSYGNDVQSSGVLSLNGSYRFGWSAGGAAMYAPSGGLLGLVYNGGYYVQVDSSGTTFNAATNFAAGTVTLNNAVNVILGSSTGSKFGTSTSQKLAFYNSTPIVQSANTTDLGTVLSNLGLRASGTAYPITTSGTKNFTDLTASKLVLTDGSSNLVSSTTALLIAAGVPVVVKTGRVTAQTAANTSVATYTTPASDGSYEISGNVLVITSTVHSFTMTVDYTDEGNTARTVTLNFSTLAGVLSPTIANAGGAVPYEGVPLHIRTKASTAITFKTAGTFTTVTYYAEGIIRQLA